VIVPEYVEGQAVEVECPACGADVDENVMHNPPCSGCISCGLPWGDGHGQTVRTWDEDGESKLCEECTAEARWDSVIERRIDERRGHE
jgi:hypothetical protein